MNSGIKILLLLILCPGLQYAAAQANLTGVVSDTAAQPVALANIAVMGTSLGTVTNAEGFFSLQVPTGRNLEVTISCVGYENQVISLRLEGNEVRNLNIRLKTVLTELDEVSVSARQERASTLSRIDPGALRYLPATTNAVESLIKTLPGVASNNELSSNYSVRGGNFDENLVYVNDIEIYRPFLVRSGQQEGLSFINEDMVSSIRFSAGGFDARFGDKMSSVLDISYRRPEKTGGSVSASMLGGSVSLEGASLNKRFSHLTGIRYKSNAYLLNSLETEGEYKPRFTDLQTYLSYQLNSKTELSFLGNLAINSYSFFPEIKTTEFGTAKTPLALKVYYEGNETDRFLTSMGALSMNYKPRPEMSLKFNASAFTTQEEETFDILGQYLINELDNRAGSDTYGDSILNIGIGSFLNHARNYLDARVYSMAHNGNYETGSHRIKWGARYEYQEIYDRLSEWEMVDSAGFSLPYSEETLELYDVIKAKNQLYNQRLSAYLQDTWGFRSGRADYFLTYGMRASWQALNGEFLASPRAVFSVNPNWDKDLMFHFAAGLYHQPPFYKEMRNFSGVVNKKLQAQRSVHFVLGGDYIFQAWERPFKFSAEMYYKLLDRLVPYKVDNVRIRYAGDNLAKGYATGLDLKINGEFVKGAESWASLSFMRTREDIVGDAYQVSDTEGNTTTVYPGYYPRPTDQLVNFGLYFQDYFPNRPDFKVQMSFLYGSRLPYSSADRDRYDNVFRLPPYRRVDIGFSKVLKREGVQPDNFLRHVENAWITAEVFNLLGINNTISYLWLRTVSNQEGIPGMFAVPNYLTSRRFNLKFSVTF
jgi:hypothetical protein